MDVIKVKLSDKSTISATAASDIVIKLDFGQKKYLTALQKKFMSLFAPGIRIKKGDKISILYMACNE